MSKPEYSFKRCEICGALQFMSPRMTLCSECVKTRGMKLAAENRSKLLGQAREAAEACACNGKSITIEDVYVRLADWTKEPLEEVMKALGPAAGSVFKGKRWVFTGERVNATLNRANHARELKKWRFN